MLTVALNFSNFHAMRFRGENRAEFPDLIFRGRRSLSGFVRIFIKTSTNVLPLQITDMVFIINFIINYGEKKFKMKASFNVD